MLHQDFISLMHMDQKQRVKFLNKFRDLISQGMAGEKVSDFDLLLCSESEPMLIKAAIDYATNIQHQNQEHS